MRAWPCDDVIVEVIAGRIDFQTDGSSARRAGHATRGRQYGIRFAWVNPRSADCWYFSFWEFRCTASDSARRPSTRSTTRRISSSLPLKGRRNFLKTIPQRNAPVDRAGTHPAYGTRRSGRVHGHRRDADRLHHVRSGDRRIRVHPDVRERVDRSIRPGRSGRPDGAAEGRRLGLLRQRPLLVLHAVSGASNEMFSDFEMHVIVVPQIASFFGAGTRPSRSPIGLILRPNCDHEKSRSFTSIHNPSKILMNILVHFLNMFLSPFYKQSVTCGFPRS